MNTVIKNDIIYIYVYIQLFHNVRGRLYMLFHYYLLSFKALVLFP